MTSRSSQIAGDARGWRSGSLTDPLTEALPFSYRVSLAILVFTAFLTQAKFIPSIRNNIGPFEVLGLLLIGVFFISPRTRWPLVLNRPTQVALAILVVAVISQVNIPQGRGAAGITHVMIQAFFALFLVTILNVLYQYRVSPKSVLHWVTLALLVVGPWIIASGLSSQGSIQEVGPFRNRAHMASYMLTAFWMALVYSQWPNLKLRSRLLAYSGVAMSLYAVAVSGRRSVYLSLLVGLAILGVSFLISSRHNRLRLVVAGVFVAGILYSMYQYGPRYVPQLAFFQDRVAMIDDRLGDALAVSEDVALEKGFFALQREGVRLAFSTHPIIGIGWGGFAKSHFSPTGHEVHSTPLRFLAETGMVGLSLYVILMLTLAQSVWRSFLRMRGTPFGNAYLVLAVGLSSLLVSYAYNRHVTERTFWLLMGVIFAMELFAARAHAAVAQARSVQTAPVPSPTDSPRPRPVAPPEHASGEGKPGAAPAESWVPSRSQ